MTRKEHLVRLFGAVFLGVFAFAVMPDGPWYREIGAWTLTALAVEVWQGEW